MAAAAFFAFFFFQCFTRLSEARANHCASLGSGLKWISPSFNLGRGERFRNIKWVMNLPCATLLEPGGESIWSAEGNRASKRLTRLWPRLGSGLNEPRIVRGLGQSESLACLRLNVCIFSA